MKAELGFFLDGLDTYERERGQHASGTFGRNVLEKIAALLPPQAGRSVETGCGKSTILFSHLCGSHTCYTVDDAAEPNGSLAYVRTCPLFDAGRVRFVLGPTQIMMPAVPPDHGIDVALIDGPHAWPFPDLEYFYLYRSLRPGALLIIDDIHIPSVARMYEMIREDAMFEELAIEATTGFLRRTNAPTFSHVGDDWYEQHYNKQRFPVSVAVVQAQGG